MQIADTHYDNQKDLVAESSKKNIFVTHIILITQYPNKEF